MRSRQVEEGIRLDRLVLDEGGREAQNKLHTQPTAGGRTLVDADRIKAARIGDPLGVDLTERVCRPLIRLSTHPPAAARAVRVSEPRPSTSSFCPILGRDVNPVDEGGAQLNPRLQATVARRIPMNADRVEAALTGDPAAAAEAARVSEPLPSSSSSSSSGSRQGGLSDRRGALRSIGSQLE
ncbi:hypothetical protein EVAR_35797_1 [Eumeta japonica]|uniref:Uncharacterized protein n=1 Tax=Eumeta variegata TaxID=151549 RepID=A0A4C1WR79_EUMVA|nr:hypothetical protein EVAR_35797_1 [Eumeta japonica]